MTINKFILSMGALLAFGQMTTAMYLPPGYSKWDKVQQLEYRAKRHIHDLALKTNDWNNGKRYYFEHCEKQYPDCVLMKEEARIRTFIQDFQEQGVDDIRENFEALRLLHAYQRFVLSPESISPICDGVDETAMAWTNTDEDHHEAAIRHSPHMPYS